MTAVREKAYAKINLYLDVKCKREDGFHDIKTVMHSVSLSDDIIVSVSPAKEMSIKLYVDKNSYLPTDTKNLAWRAAALFFEKLNTTANVNIKLVKRIPVSAGLAGGSSDAAAVLRALNKIYKRPFTTKALALMGAELGSDVPYCIVGKTALCEGRGDKMTRIYTDIDLNVVIASAKEHVSTPEAYRALDEKYFDFNGSALSEGEKYFNKLCEELANSKSVKDGTYNIFESVIFDKCVRSKALKGELIKLGANCAMMSGSGPSVFAIFNTEEQAKIAKEHLISKGFYAWVARTV